MDITQFRPRVRVILRRADLNTITAKAVRCQIQEENEVDLSSCRKEFDGLVMEVLEEIQGTAEGAEEPPKPSQPLPQSQPSAPKPSEPTPKPKPTTFKPSASSGRKSAISEAYVHDSDDDRSNDGQLTDEQFARRLQQEESSRSRTGKRKAAPAPKKVKSEGTKRKAGGGFSAPWMLSAELSAVCGGAPSLSRGQVVKQLWEYIKSHNLQDPSNGKKIICDEALEKVFGKKRVDSFTMMKYLGAHLWKAEEADERVVEDTSSEEEEDGDGEREERPKKVKREVKKESSTKATKAKKEKGAGGGWNAPQLLSPALRTVIEEAMEQQPVNALARPATVKQLWVYIKAHDLQDPNDKRNVVADEKLKKVFGRGVVTMFSMNRYLKDQLRPVPAGMNPETTRWEDVYGDGPVKKEVKEEEESGEDDEEEEAEETGGDEDEDED